MDTGSILRLLKNSGFHNLKVDSQFVYMEDPSCILRGFEDFVGYAWIFVTIITGILLVGWAIALIRGAKISDLGENIKYLVLMFGVLSLAYPIMNVIFGSDMFASGCKTISVPIEEVNELLEQRKKEFDKYNEFEEFEIIDIIDSGVTIPTEE